MQQSFAYFDQFHEHLSLPDTTHRDYHYMDTLLDIAKGYRDNQKDDFLANSVIQTCIDVVPDFYHLPQTLQKTVKYQLGIEEKVKIESIALSNEQQMSLKKQVGIQQEIALFMQNQTMSLMDWSAGPSASSGTVLGALRRLCGRSTGWVDFFCVLSFGNAQDVLSPSAGSGTVWEGYGGGRLGTLRQVLRLTQQPLRDRASASSATVKM